MYHNGYHHNPRVRPPTKNKTHTNSIYAWISKKGLWFLGIVLFTGSIFWILKPVLAILAASVGIAYILEPSIQWFERKGLSREKAVGASFLYVLLSLLTLGLLIIPPIVIQFDNLALELTERLHSLETEVGPLLVKLESLIGRDIPIDFEQIKIVIIDFVKTHAPQVQAYLGSIGQLLLTQGLGLVSTIINLILLPIFIFYICRDRTALINGLFNIIPNRFHDTVRETASEVDQRLSAFIKAQFRVCLYLAILYTVGLLLVGIKLALPIGILSGILFLIPYIGTIIGLLSSLTICLINFGIAWQLVGVLLVYIIVHNIESFILVPYLVGDKVGLSPMVVMIALIVGGSLLGIWGMVLAIPITAILSVISSRWIESYRESEFYKHK